MCRKLAFLLCLSTLSAIAQKPAPRTAQPNDRSADCSTLNYKLHKVAWLCGKASVCSGDICLRPSLLGFDNNFGVVLRSETGKELERKSLSYEKPNFCFDEHGNGDYQIAFVLYTNGVPEPARVFPTRYKRNPKKLNDAIYLIQATCPKPGQ